MLTQIQLVSIAGVFLSLAFAYIPGVKEWFDGKDATGKARIMGLALVVVAVGIFGLACAKVISLFGLDVACTAQSAASLINLLIAALVANQSAYMLLVRPNKSPRTL